MDVSKSLIAALAVACLSTAAQAQQRPYPSSDMMVPGSNAVGTPDYAMKAKASAAASNYSPDSNGDGFVDASEVEPGSRWATRLQTRDVNGDGKLSRDEYWFQ